MPGWASVAEHPLDQSRDAGWVSPDSRELIRVPTDVLRSAQRVIAYEGAPSDRSRPRSTRSDQLSVIRLPVRILPRHPAMHPGPNPMGPSRRSGLHIRKQGVGHGNYEQREKG